MKHTSLFLTAALLACFAHGCAENPADGVDKAKVEDILEKPASPSPSSVQVRKFAFSDTSSIGFVGSKITGQHEGGFKKFTGHFSVSEDALAPGPHEIVINMESTWADHPKLEAHLKSADFFDVETYPVATFKLTALRQAEGARHNLSGEFTLHGTTKAIAFPAEITPEKNGYRLVAKFSINRKDFGIRYPGKPDDLIRDEVVIVLDLLALPST